jgi:2-isopropylmalate synthase
MKTEKLYIFDTTLRDGEQSPGASMNADEKLRIARILEKLGVDIIEAGFAISSPGDFAAIQTIAKTIKDSTICSLSRARKGDVERAAEAVKPAQRPRIHTFIATSPIHMQHKLHLRPDEVVEHARAAVSLARNFTDDVEFSCEDACRSEIDFLCRVLEVAIDAGATTVNIPDTVGYSEPKEYGQLIRTLMERIPNAAKVVFSAHCQNDLGLAAANSLAAVQNGARQVECTINGLGERAGNASLEEVVMAVKVRPDLFKVRTDIVTEHIVPISRLVSGVTGFAVQPNKAIVGSNAFAHEAGIHQDGILKHRGTYEIMRAEDVGWKSNALVLGKHSGRNAFRLRIEELCGKIADDKLFESMFQKFKELADIKHDIYDEDLQALLGEVGAASSDLDKYRFERMQFESARDKRDAFASVTLKVSGKTISAEGMGVGVVDAAFNAIEQGLNSGAKLLLYSVQAIRGGTDAQGEVSVRLERKNFAVNGVGTDPDIVVASVKAYISALNRLEARSSMGDQIVGGV